MLGVRIHDNLLASDVELAMNFLEKKIRNQDHIALYAEVDGISKVEPEVTLKEIRHGLSQVMNLGHIDRAAVVTDNATILDSETVLDLLPTVDVKTFSGTEKESAKAWVSQR